MFKKILITLFFLFPYIVHAQEDGYSYGWKVPKTPLHVGGYFSLNYDDKETLAFDDIALLFYGNHDKFHILGEVEIADIALEKLDFTKNRLHIERLQVNYDVDDDGILTVGKFNSDMGYWNQTPVNVLDDTTTSPHILKNIFPKQTTGVMYKRSLKEGDAAFSAMFQHNNNIDKNYNNMVLDRHYALNYQNMSGQFFWRVGAGYFRRDSGQDAFYTGLGVSKESDTWTWLGEVFHKREGDSNDIPYDGYIQGTWHWQYAHDLVFREEMYHDKKSDVRENISLLGYTYRPWASVAVKGEYVWHSKLPKNRFVFSLSVIF